jgi:hypothetical protein
VTLLKFIANGADGVALTTANVPATTLLPASNTATNSITFAALGGRPRYRFLAPSGSQAFVRVSITSSLVQSIRAVGRRASTTTVTTARVIMAPRHSSGYIIRLQLTPTNQIQIQTGVSGFAVLGITSISGGLAADTDYEFTLDYVVGTTTTGVLRLQVFALGSSTPLAGGSVTVSSTNIGTAPSVAADVGSNDTATSPLDFAWTDIQFENDRALVSGIPTSIPSLSAPVTLSVIPGSVAFIGDSTLDQDGNGQTNVRALMTSKGYTAAKVFFYAVGSKAIMLVDANGFTTVDNMNQARTYLGGEPETWVINLGSNGHHDGETSNTGWINTVLDQVATGSRIIWSAISQRDGFDNGTSSVATRQAWNAIAKPLVQARTFGVWADWNAYIKILPGGDYSLWNTDSVHMTAAGYAVKNNFLIGQVTATGRKIRLSTPNGYLDVWMRVSNGSSLITTTPGVLKT